MITNLRKMKYFVIALLTITLFTACKLTAEVDIDVLQKEIYTPTIDKKDTLKAGVQLFVDYSTCVKEAVDNSAFFAAIRPRITGLEPTMYSIKGAEITKVSSNMDAINQELNNIAEISYADINGAVEQICNSNQQSILITDCEYWTKPQGERTDLPYMKPSFIQWLNKGYSIHVIVEPYDERYKGVDYPKKRFYFFFTDDKINNNIYNEIRKSQNFDKADVSFYKLTNADIRIYRKEDIVDENLNFSVDTTYRFDYIKIDNSWKDIEKYIMNATDDEGNTIPNGKPLITGIKFSDFENYTIEDIDIAAKNITKTYLDSVHSEALSVIIPDGFYLDKDSLKNNLLTVRIKESLFNSNYLSNEDGGNLFRLDFVIKSTKNKPVSSSIFSWDSMSKPNVKNISAFESIKQALDNPETNPAKQNKGIIHTIFIKTAMYK